MILEHGAQILRIDAGELVGYQVNGHEYIHQKGSPGWGNSDTEMFPIIGPTAEAGFQVQTPRDAAIQDQHGLLRELEYELISQTETEVVFKKSYTARTPVKNSKHPEKSNKPFLYWTYDFEFEKKFNLTENGLEISFTVYGERDTPFMLGYHPAFNLVTENPVVIAEEHSISLSQVMAVGSRAFKVIGYEEVILKDKNELQIRTEGFGNFMLWTEVPNMICIEPITFYPYEVEQKNLHEGFQYLPSSSKTFKVYISVND
ncbi:aldose 1-epimerase [Maribacter algarum]|uniref:Aldose 1-epimerase n=1 Tax=Maribacter algarum (ex Zhang et al. 2020) TaxID=2578118 RepID=A0A5S3PST8_9FLAO|nr:aldose 1-epimerase [Maribacter algarum]TMM58051.1 aldose 1-epimerase [Maribacter algarum]